MNDERWKERPDFPWDDPVAIRNEGAGLLGELMSYDKFAEYPSNIKDRVCAFVESAELEEGRSRVTTAKRMPRDYLHCNEACEGMSLALDIRNELTLNESIMAIIADRERVRQECADKAIAHLRNPTSYDKVLGSYVWTQDSIRSAIMEVQSGDN